MTIYYQHSAPLYTAVFAVTRTKTVFGLVMTCFEFWFFVALHVILCVLSEKGQPEFVNIDIRWDAITFTQFIVTLFLTFFASHCFARYTELYDQSMTIIDGILLFVQELVVSMNFAELENHRLGATKYMLAVAYVLFISVTKGALTKQDWRTIVDKGLLTVVEAQQLARFPARSHEVVFVLASWAMQTVDDGLQHDLMWEPRSFKTVHCHNRANAHCTRTLKACHEITTTMSLPLPFPYFHLVSVVLLLNAFLLAVAASSFKTYMTIVPYTVGQLFFIGVREIAATLLDPFGPDDVHFPVDAFLEYTFGNAICLLEAFRNPEATKVSSFLERCQPFTDKQLRQQTDVATIYKKNYDPVTSSPFAWNKEMPMQQFHSTKQEPSEILSALVFPGAAASIGEPKARLGLAYCTREGIPTEEETEEEKKREEEEDKKLHAVDEDHPSVAKGSRSFLARLCGRKKSSGASDPLSDNNDTRNTTSRLTKLQEELRHEEERNAELEAEAADLRVRIQTNRQKLEALGIAVPTLGNVGLTKEDATIVVDGAFATGVQQQTEPPIFHSFEEARQTIRRGLEMDAIVAAKSS
eukprot:TRINITY_DN9415_c0_g1_i1.p1 TRINITY_DN9415_c0_g1~~TRINITY_DN9415_c0_g1_i1.p1  ORF type:complete len:582 (-),score=124.99 TRINITY_DN9415_c0_g1_i1:19-1764(-)